MREQKTRVNFIQNRKGFTMVELIVVLAIISILSSVAVFSIIGYIDQSRFDRNEQNAQSIYQAVQTALERKKNSGEIEQWVCETWIDSEAAANRHADQYNPTNCDKDANAVALDNYFVQKTFDEFPKVENTVGDSVHMRYTLTYTKDGNGGDNDAIRDLVGGYFYDTTILDATFTIEFDVEKTLGGDEKTVHYTANAYAVFYDEKRTGWDEKAVNGTVSNNPRSVPCRDYTYRSDKSLVGYYNGGNPSAVDSVYTPMVNDKMEFAELAMRNGERLELSFSVYNGDKKITGMTDEEGKPYHIHYTASLYDQYDHNNDDNNGNGKWLADLVISEAYLTQKPTLSSPDIKTNSYSNQLYFKVEDFQNGHINDGQVDPATGAVYSVDKMTDDLQKSFTRYKASLETKALVYVNKDKENFDYNDVGKTALGLDSNYYWFPMTVSYVVKIYDSGEKKEYVSYTLALDAMMTRQALYEYEDDVKKTTGGERRICSSITRILPNTKAAVSSKNLAPRNIYVSMTAAVDAFSVADLEKYNVTTNLPSSERIKAKRAYDDPVYLLSNGTFCYSDQKAKGDCYGYAVCNSYFGDLSADGDNEEPRNGSFSIKYEIQTACITSFRHIYNMRFTEKYAPKGASVVTYEIRRDLNWYMKMENQYTSDVVVYDIVSDGLIGHSPSGKIREYTDELSVVSWPALSVFGAKQKLVALDNQLSLNDDKTSVMRNVQMRRYSFWNTDKGYGFICENKGILRNIRCENFSLTLDAVTDGDPDKANISEVMRFLVDHGAERADRKLNRNLEITKFKVGNFERVPVGGLVGLQSGTLGESDDGKPNTIQMSNTVALGGLWNENEWYLVKLVNDENKFHIGVGSVAGKYAAGASSGGTIICDGRFAIAGSTYVGGVFGSVYGNVDARLILDSNNSKETVIDYPTDIQALVMGTDIVGGAVGYVNSGSFSREVTDYSYSYVDSGVNEGVVNISKPDDAVYGVDVNLATNTYVWLFGTVMKNQYAYQRFDGIGGAIGQINSYNGDVLSINVSNSGYVLGNCDFRGRYVGGTIGYMHGGSVKKMYLHATNSGKIGTLNGNDALGAPHSASVGVAYMTDFGAAGDIYIIDVENTDTGKLICKIYDNGDDSTYVPSNAGVGLAIGAAIPTSGASPIFYIRTINNGTIKGINSTKVEGYGVGGAIGYISSLQNSHIYSEIREGASFYCSGYNAGGAIGMVKDESSGKNANEPLTITASLQTGAVIQSDGSNVGGCVGTMLKQGNYSGLRTRILGNCMVTGTDNVGGVAGRQQQSGGGEGAIVCLQGEASSPILTVQAKSCDVADARNIGGAIGMVGTNGTYKTSINMPKQEENDNLILSVEGYENIGGMIGYMCMSDLTTPSNHYDCKTQGFSVILNPASTIKAVNEHAGGAIGFLEEQSDKHFYSNVNVTINKPTDATAEVTPVITGKIDVGGAVGAINAKNFDGNIGSYIYSSNAVSGTAQVGGAVGSCALVNTMGSVTAVLGAEGTVIAEKQAGGCIGGIADSGSIEKTAVYKSVNAVMGSLEGVSNISPIYGNYQIGGCIGCVAGNQNLVIKNATTTVNTTGNIITKNLNSAEEVCRLGGVVGGMTESCTLENAVVDGNSTEFLLNIPECKDAGGIAGYLASTGVLAQNMQIAPSVTINGQQNLGGYIGQLDGAVVGLAGSTLEATGIKLIAATDDASNAGGIIGVISNNGTVNGNVRFAPASECLVSGVNCVGGVIGESDNGIINGNIEFSPALSCRIDGNNQTGGLIGEFKSGNLNGNITFNPAGECAIAGGSNTGGLIGYNSGNVIGDIEFKPVAGCAVTGGENTGGLIGQMESGSVNGKKEIVLGDLCSISGNNNTGGMIGLLQGEAKAYGNADLKLGEGALISGGAHVGGMIGLVDNGDIGQGYGTDAAQNLTIHLAGGYVVGSGQGLGGVVGTMGTGTAGKLTTYVEYAYSLTDASACAINTGESHYPAIGGVVGQISRENDLVSEVKVDGMFLRLKKDFAILSGKNSVGGVLGRCESQNGEILDMAVKSEDGNNHELIIRPNNGKAFDIGGVAGYLYGTLKRSITTEKVSVTARGTSGVGGWIGSLDGKLGTASNGGRLNASGVMNITASEYGAGGVIGTMGRWHDSGAIHGKLVADLKDSTIECTGDGGAGGIIGNAGASEKGSDGKNYSAAIHSDLTIKMQNVEITGKVNAGGAIGYIKEGSTVDEDCNIYVKVTGTSSVNATGTNFAGGIVGSNKGVFLAGPVMNISADYSITAGVGGFVGTVMGRNDGAFGRTSSATFAVPVTGDDRVKLDAHGLLGFTGAVLGRNTGNCGILTKGANGEYTANGSGTLTYKTSVNLTGVHLNTLGLFGRWGYVGWNWKMLSGINNISMDWGDQASGDIDDTLSDLDYTDDALDEMTPEDYEEYYPSLKTDEELFEDEMPIEEDQQTNVVDEFEEPENVEEENGPSETGLNNVDGAGDESDIPEKEDSEEEKPESVNGEDFEDAEERDEEDDFEIRNDFEEDEDSDEETPAA